MNKRLPIGLGFISFLLFLLTSQTLASNNLTPEDYYGNWLTTHELTDDEVTRLSITKDGEVRFSREFESSPAQFFVSSTGNTVNNDGILIYQFGAREDQIMYRLVLSGWSTSGGTRRIFGTLYLYRKGVLFNGLPIQFEPVE